MNTTKFKLARQSIESIKGPLIFLNPSVEPMYNGLITIEEADGRTRHAQIIEVSENVVVAQVFEGTYHLDKLNSYVIEKNDIFKLNISDTLLGNPLSGLGVPLNPNIKVYPEITVDVNSNPINPIKRDVPKNPIETGIPAIDGLNTLVMGQKLPIFSGPGLPSNELAVKIATHVSSNSKNTLVVFGAMGITRREGRYFIEQLQKSAGSSNIAFFLNYINDPSVERLLTPRCALTLAEHYAFKKGRDVLVILTDMLRYAESLREISSAREEMPGRRGYPGYLYTDLATLYERAGRIIGVPGSITQIPILTMPNYDITHPVPDLTAYISEGQIVLSQDLYFKHVNPPIDILSSLSRLMNSGIGQNQTREDHKSLANQLYACYAEGRRLKQLISITGEESLSLDDKKYLQFCDLFESIFVSNSKEFSFINTLDLGWQLLSIFHQNKLNRIPRKILDKYFIKYFQDEELFMEIKK